MASRIEHTFLRRVQALPRDTQRLLLTAAAEPLGDSALLWRAVERLGIDPAAAPPAEAAELIELGIRVRFKHPLVRSAVYRGADVLDRREVHAALAHVTDLIVDPDRCAWHRAHATAIPDEEVAVEMARSADRAQCRGGLAAAAAFLQRAAELTPDPARRVERLLAAAQAKLDVADAVAASNLLAAAALGPVEALQGARIERLGARIRVRQPARTRRAAVAARRGQEARSIDAAMARETYLEAMASAMFAGRLGTGPSEREMAEAARASHRMQDPGAAEALLDALVTRFHRGVRGVRRAAAAQALRAFDTPDCGGEDRHWLWLACRLSQDALGRRALALARDLR